jgi:hypothetical protein
MVLTTQAGLREPDNVIFGTIILGTNVITALQTNVVVEARRSADSSVVASYAMGSNPSASNFYSLRIIVENAAPLSDPNASLAGDILNIVVKDPTGDRDAKTFTVSDRGTIVEVDFGSLDSDGNGLPDVWEIQYFGHIGVDPNSMPAGDGMTVMQKFLLGINPTLADAPHPADDAPFDYTISITEVTAYGLAWKTGKPWTSAPTNIPVDYVTRAGALWKGGEAYTLNMGVSASAPLWWVNTTNHASGHRVSNPLREVGAGSATDAASAVIRTLPDGFQAGEPVTVELAVVPAGSVNAYAVEETVPAGWEVTDTSDQGVYHAASGIVRWGPFFDAQARTLAYNVRPASLASGAFSGVGSFDGANAAIEGDSELMAGGVLTRLQLSMAEGEGVNLVLKGHPGRSYVVEVSSDLRSWVELVQAAADSGGNLAVEDPTTDSNAIRFYRARLVTSGN